MDEEAGSAFPKARHSVDSGVAWLRLNQVIKVVFKVLVVGSPPQSLSQIQLDPRREDTDPLIEAVAPSFIGTLLVGLGAVLLIDSESDVGHLGDAAGPDSLIHDLQDSGLVPHRLVVRVDGLAGGEGVLPSKELFGLGLKLGDLYGPSVYVSICTLGVIDELQVERVAIDLVDARLGPPAAALAGLVDDRVDHVALLELLAPLLVGRAEALELLLGYLVAVEVHDGVVVEDIPDAVEEDGVVLAELEHG